MSSATCVWQNTIFKLQSKGYGQGCIDVNGAKSGPNAVGKDFFCFEYKSDLKLYTFNITDYRNNYHNSSPYSCFQKVKDDDWESKYF